MRLTLAYPKTCILCKYFCFYSGNDTKSEDTPGSDWYSHCNLSYRWHMSGEEVGAEEYRKKLLTAENCPDFDLCEMLKNR